MSQVRFRAKTLTDNSYNTNYPSPTERVIDMSTLNGGLNLWELDYRMDANQSPDCLNVYWKDGCLSSRPGQAYIYEQTTTSETQYGAFRSCYGSLWQDYIVAHKGNYLYKISPSTGVHTVLTDGTSSVNVGSTGGHFFVFDTKLYYFTGTGGYYYISASFVVSAVVGYIPTVSMNRVPNGTGGDEYQPENRIAAGKRLLYTPYYVETYASQSAFPTTGDVNTYYYSTADADYYVYGSSSGYTVSEVKPNIYYLPYSGLDATTVELRAQGLVSGQLQWITYTEVTAAEFPSASDTSFKVDRTNGVITFKAHPYQPSLESKLTNSVEITVYKSDTDTYNSIMNCKCVGVYGGDTDLLVVLGGNAAQPNAYFWSGNTSVGVDPSYFPFDYYNLAGANADDAITGFGHQQSMLVIFKEHSIGKTSLTSTTTTASDDDDDTVSRILIQLPYVAINDVIGCDVPSSIRLVQNNLMFANTYGGVYVLLSSTAYGENNVKRISRNIEGDGQSKGLLAELRTTNATVSSFDDGDRYWLIANGNAYLWDYSISSYSSQEEKLSWFYFTNINALGWVKSIDSGMYFTANGSLSGFTTLLFNDYGNAIHRRYTFATQNFGTYEVLKDVKKVIFAVRSDTDSEMEVTYHTDYELRADRTPISARGWHLVPRNLSYRSLRPIAFAAAAVRKPRCFHIRHFAMILDNNTKNTDMSIVSAQIIYTYCRKDR